MKDKMKQICIKDTFHVLKLQVNLFSVSKLLLNGLKMHLNLNECIVRGLTREVISLGLRNGNLYEINFKKVHEVDVMDLVQS